MSVKVAEHIRERLRAWGVEQVFSRPGDEETAALEAVGHARSGSRLGVCAATTGPGAVRLLNGLSVAGPDHVPVLALIGETDPHGLRVDMTFGFVRAVTEPGRLPDVIDEAVRTAYARRCPTAVIVPGDVDVRALARAPLGPASESAAPDPATPAGPPSPEDLRRAADVLNAGDKAAVLIGQGAAGARAEVEEIAELLGAGVAKTLLAKDALSDELPGVTGVIGPLGTRPSYELMRDCDTLLTVGSSLPPARFLPGAEPVRAVRIDIEPLPAGNGRPDEAGAYEAGAYEAGLVGDAGATLRALIPLIDGERRGVRHEWRDEIRAGMTRWRDVLRRRAELSADPVNPEYVAHVLDRLLPKNTVLTCDSGPVAAWCARHLTLRDGMRAVLPGTPDTSGCGLPYAIGAKYAHPDRPVIALVGDGTTRLDGMAELADAAACGGRWDDPRLVVAVWHERDPGTPYAEIARSLGLTGVLVERPGEVEDAWRTALAADGPTVVDFRTDPAVRPVPPHATWGQFEAAAAAVLRGEAGPAAVKQGLKAKVQEFLPGDGGGDSRD
ncbi:thiamine pyrophosphate-dependent enzyme [Streptomyces flavofungini]|uniref:thiamine pyrophosphate-dependent enzyme n=1 Tax=Streptomyces flavofungini TaxID=68200 RepID=UPI0034DF6160